MLKSDDDINDPRVKRQKTVGDSTSAAQIPQVPPSSSASNEHLNDNLSDHITRSHNEHAGGLDRFRNEHEVQTPLETPKPGKSVGLSDSFRDWKVGDRYQLIRLLGRGSYGEVAQAMDIFAKQLVAIKRITSAFQQDIDALRLYREIHILRRLKGHDCIINLIDVVQPLNLEEFQDLYLVFEYVDTDLYKLIMSPQYLTTEHIQTFLYQMLAGLRYIHSSSVIHRDLKPANILLNEDCSLKICDFGLARIITPSPINVPSEEANGIGVTDEKKRKIALDSQPVSKEIFRAVKSLLMPNNYFKKRGLTRQLTKHVVTRWYRAPELILVQPYTSAVDVWSIGCILAELLSMQEGNYQDRAPLFPGGSCYPLSGKEEKESRLDQLNVIIGIVGTPEVIDGTSAAECIKQLPYSKGKPLETLYPSADPNAIDLLKNMLQFYPEKRCTAEQALEHPFLKNVRRKDMEIDGLPLQIPEFLDSPFVDIDTIKRHVYDEVRWYQGKNT